MSSSDRACLRCISKKRRCDHEQPTCGLCLKAKQVCEYPTKRQKRGPTAGSFKASEVRVQQLENALYFVMSLHDVSESLHKWMESRQTQDQIPQAPSASIERSKLMTIWTERPLTTYGDLLDFRQSMQDMAKQKNMSEDCLQDDVMMPDENDSIRPIASEVQNEYSDEGNEPVPREIDCPVEASSNPQENSLDFLASNAVTQLPIQTSAQNQETGYLGSDFSPSQLEPFDYILHSDQPPNLLCPPQRVLPSLPIPSHTSPTVISNLAAQMPSHASSDPSNLFW